MSGRFLFANALSLVAALFMCLAAVAGRRRLVYFYQSADCVFLLLAQLIFGYPSSALMLGLGAVRNLLVSRSRYSFRLMTVFLILTVALSAASGGIFSLSVLPLFATVLMTLAPIYAVGILSTKLFLMTTQLIWVIYSVLIFDIATAVSNSVAALLALASILQYALRKGRNEH